MSAEGRPAGKGPGMSKGSGAGRDQPSKASVGPDPTAARGIALVALTIVVGFFLLAKGLDSEDAIVDLDSGSVVTTTEPGGDPDTSGDDGGTPALTIITPTTRPPADVRVLVANGSGVARAASRISDQLQPGGYVILDPTNAPETAATVVYFAEGFQADAEAVATTLGAAKTSVQAMPDPRPAEIEGSDQADVLVQLGPDVASAG